MNLDVTFVGRRFSMKKGKVEQIIEQTKLPETHARGEMLFFYRRLEMLLKLKCCHSFSEI